MRRPAPDNPTRTAARVTGAVSEHTLIVNEDAARRWLVRVVSARAVQLYREERDRRGSEPKHTDEGHHGSDSAT